MVIFGKLPIPVAWYILASSTRLISFWFSVRKPLWGIPGCNIIKFWQKLFELIDANGRTDGRTMANSIVPLPHFVRRGTKMWHRPIPMQNVYRTFIKVTTKVKELHGNVSQKLLGGQLLQGNLDNWTTFGTDLSGHISEVVTLSRWFKHEKIKMSRPKSGLFLKVVWLSRWSHSKVPLYKSSDNSV